MTIGLSTTLRNNRIAEITSAVGNAGKLVIYSGTRPATGGTPAGTVLATFTLGTPFAGSPSNGVISPTLPSNATASASGTATFARLTTSADAFVADFTVTNTAGDGEVKLASTSISSGGSVGITSWSFAEGYA